MRRPAFARVTLRRLSAASGGGGGGVTVVNVSAPITKSGPATSPTIGISAATTGAAGSMSAADKTKLDGIGPGAAVVSVGVTAPIQNTGTATVPVIAISAATTGAAGSMSAADKTKLDGIGAGAAVVSVGFTSPMQNGGTATAPVVGILNTGSTAGRAMLPVLIERRNFTFNTGANNTQTWTAGAYRFVYLKMSITSGAGAITTIKPNNLTGTDRGPIVYGNGATAGSGGVPWTVNGFAPLFLSCEFYLPQGFPKGGTVASSISVGQTNFCASFNDDTVNDPTAITINVITNTMTGTYDLYGVP